MSWDIPNWISLIIEIPIGLLLAIVIYKLQSRTDKYLQDILKEIKESTTKIDSYVGTKRKLEENEKCFYCNKIIENLKYIKTEHEKVKETAKGILNNDIPNEKAVLLVSIRGSEIQIIRIPEIEESLNQLRGSLKNPQIWFEIRTYLTVLDGPYRYFRNGEIWANKNMPLLVIDIADIQLEEINKYLKLLESECAK